MPPETGSGVWETGACAVRFYCYKFKRHGPRYGILFTSFCICSSAIMYEKLLEFLKYSSFISKGTHITSTAKANMPWKQGKKALWVTGFSFHLQKHSFHVSENNKVWFISWSDQVLLRREQLHWSMANIAFSLLKTKQYFKEMNIIFQLLECN